jgi:lipoprotein-releasing system ATP-binding protein
MSLLDATGITKSFVNGDEVTQVLKGVDVRLEPGEMIALLGPSGSGKSTLLNILGLLMRPTSGAIALLGQPLTGLSDRALSRYRNSHIGFVFQFHHLLPDFTALENVAFPAAAPAGGISREIRTRAASLLDRVGLTPRANYLATRLSGGQKQRAAIARSLINTPDLVLADEPTGNLDRDNSDAVMALLRDINQRERTTFLISTHDPAIAARCDRRIEVVDGRLASG